MTRILSLLCILFLIADSTTAHSDEIEANSFTDNFPFDKFTNAARQLRQLNNPPRILRELPTSQKYDLADRTYSARTLSPGKSRFLPKSNRNYQLPPPYLSAPPNFSTKLVQEQAANSPGFAIVEDGENGAIYIWESILGEAIGIVAQRVNANGVKLWNNGSPVVLTSGPEAHRRNPVAISDGQGGAFVAFQTVFLGDLTGKVDIYGQRVNSEGVSLWSSGPEIPITDAVPIATTTNIQRNPAIVLDGAGGIIVALELELVGGDFDGNTDVVGQRLDGQGSLLWNDGIGVVALISTPQLDRGPVAVSDGAGGIIVVIELEFTTGEFTGFTDIVAQRIDPSGALLWNVDGSPVAVTATAFAERNPVAISDGQGGVIVAAELQFLQDVGGVQVGDIDLVAQRVDANGIRLWNDGNTQVLVGTDHNDHRVSMASDGAGGAFFIAEFEFIFGDLLGDTDIVGQYVTATGLLPWGNGVLIRGTNDIERRPAVTADGIGGVIMAYELQFAGAANDVDVFADQINSDETYNWDEGQGTPIMISGRQELNPLVVSDGSGGIILAAASVGDVIDIVGQRASSAGVTVWSGPSIPLTVSDDIPSSQPPDGGGQAPEATISAPGDSTDEGMTSLDDGQGGAIYFWEAVILDQLAILGQRVDQNGQKLWNNGSPVIVSAGTSAHRRNPVAVSDGSGGAFVAFEVEFTSGDFIGQIDVFGQRISGSGITLSNLPFPILGTDFQERNPEITPDSAGGAIVVAELEFSLDGSTTDLDIVGQRVDAGGVPLWNEGAPIPIIATTDQDNHPLIVSDGAGGAIVFGQIQFLDSASQPIQIDIAGQRMNALGDLLWNTGSPIPAIASSFVEQNPVAIADGSGGAVVVCETESTQFLGGVLTSSLDIVGQRIDPGGNPLWAGGTGLPILATTQVERNPVITPNGAGGFVVIAEVVSDQSVDIAGQSVTGAGALNWNNGEPITVFGTSLDEQRPAAISDGQTGVLVVAELAPTDDLTANRDIIGQRINGAGSLQWNNGNALPILLSESLEQNPLVVTDGASGLIVAAKLVGASVEIVAQRVDTIGELVWNAGAPASVSEETATAGPSQPTGPPIATIAGSGASGFGGGGFFGDGGPATEAGFRDVSDVVVDAAGNIYVADRVNNRIRRIDATSRTVSTIAGNGANDSFGDGGHALLAGVNSPSALFIDASANIYITERNDHRIRKVSPDGIITAVAGTGEEGFSGDGGPATDAALNSPQGIFVDAAGDIYIADENNHRIRKIDAATGLISTIAGAGPVGTEIGGLSGDGLSATTASLNNPRDIFLDTSGNLFIADTGNHRIRRIDSESGIITTFAGSDPGFSGDGGLAADATFGLPSGLFLDNNNNAFIADSGNNRIRRIDALTDSVTTVAGSGLVGTGAGSFSGDGGPAVLATMDFPKAVAVDTSGNLLIADALNSRVRIIESIAEPSSFNVGIFQPSQPPALSLPGLGPATLGAGPRMEGPLHQPGLAITEPQDAGTIRTLAGGAVKDGLPAIESGLAYPNDVISDSEGNLFISDGTYNRIRRVDSLTGMISTVTGTGVRGYSGDGGPATEAQLFLNWGIGLDANGNLYIADRNNHRIRKVDSQSGIISTVAGTGVAGFSGDGQAATEAQLDDPISVEIDAEENLFIADRDNHRIRKVDGQTGVISTIAGNGVAGILGNGESALLAELGFPESITLNSSGDLFIATGSRVRKVDASTGIISAVAGTTSGFFGDGEQATESQLNDPQDIAVDASGNLFIADRDNARIRKVDVLTGAISTFAGGDGGFAGDSGPAALAQLRTPEGITIDGSGNFYVVDKGNHRIRKIDSAGTTITTVAGGALFTDLAAVDAGLTNPRSVIEDTDGNLLVSATGNSRILKIDALSGLISTVAGTGIAGYSGDNGPATDAQLNYNAGISLDAAGNLLIADWRNHRIRKVDLQTGLISTVAGSDSAGFSGDGGPATIAQLRNPESVVADLVGNLYISDTANQRIRKVDGATGIITTFAGDGFVGGIREGESATLASLNFLRGIALDANGDLYIADRRNHQIHRIDVGTGIITTAAGSGLPGSGGDGESATLAQFNDPSTIAFDADGNLYISDRDNHSIRKVNLLTDIVSTVVGTGTRGYSGDEGSAVQAQLSAPYGITITASGDLLIADNSNHRVRRVADIGSISTEIQEPSTEVGPLALDLNLDTGDQGKRSTRLPLSAGDTVTLDLAITEGAQGISGFQSTISFNPVHVAFQTFSVTDLLTGALPISTPGQDSVQVNAVLLGDVTVTGDSGSLGQITFQILEGFSGETQISISAGQLATSAGFQDLSIGPAGATATILGGTTPDFTGDGSVDFQDFLLFAAAFGTQVGQENYDARLDLDGSGSIDFPDFLQFASAFGTSGTTKPVPVLAKLAAPHLLSAEEADPGDPSADWGDERSESDLQE